MRRIDKRDEPKGPRWDKGNWNDLLTLALLAIAILLALKALAVC